MRVSDKHVSEWRRNGPVMTGNGRPVADLDPFVVRKGADETDGEFVRFEATMYPHPDSDGAVDLPHERWGLDNDFEHVNPRQDERFEVLSGRLRAVYDGVDRELTAGESVTIPAGTRHRHWNPAAEPARVVWERRPARRTEAWAESVYALAQAGLTDENGIPENPLRSAVIFDEYPDDTYPASVPVPLQKLAFSLLASVGRRLGYEATYAREEIDDLA